MLSSDAGLHTSQHLESQIQTDRNPKSIPSITEPLQGCVFRTRCHAAITAFAAFAAFAEALPPMEAAGTGHHGTCIRHRDLNGQDMPPESRNRPTPPPVRPG